MTRSRAGVVSSCSSSCRWRRCWCGRLPCGWSSRSVSVAVARKSILADAAKELADGRIFLHAADSIKRVLLGVVLATATGVPLGIVIGYWRSTRDWTSTLINAGRVLPPASLIPIAVVWFGIGDAPAVFLIWFTCVWPILLNTASGVQNVEKILRDGALTLGANARDIVTTVLFPSAIPQIAAGVRIAFGLGWSVVVTSELLAVRNGLGFYIWDARLTFSMEKVSSGSWSSALSVSCSTHFCVRLNAAFSVGAQGDGQYLGFGLDQVREVPAGSNA